MKKNLLSKIVILTVTTAICLSSTCIPFTYAGQIAELQELETMMPQPRYIAIILCVNKLTLGSGGKLNCQGGTDVQDGYTAEVIVELQRQNGNNWSTIKSWSHSNSRNALINRDYYVENGTYRLQLTHYAKTSSGAIADSTVKHSKTVTY